MQRRMFCHINYKKVSSGPASSYGQDQIGLNFFL